MIVYPEIRKFFALGAALFLCACGLDSFNIQPIPINDALQQLNIGIQ